jgi:hypothetical protein
VLATATISGTDALTLKAAEKLSDPADSKGKPVYTDENPEATPALVKAGTDAMASRFTWLTWAALILTLTGTILLIAKANKRLVMAVLLCATVVRLVTWLALGAGLDRNVAVAEGSLYLYASLPLLIFAAFFSNHTAQLIVFHGKHFITGGRHLGKAGNFNRHGGTGGLYAFAAIVQHGTHTAGSSTGNNVVTNLQRTVLQQHGGQRTAGLIQLGFDNNAGSHTVGIGTERQHVCLQEDQFQQFIHAFTGHGGNRSHDSFAAPFFRDQFVLGQFFLDLCTGFEFLLTDFRMGMEPAAHLDQIFLIFLCSSTNIHDVLLTAGRRKYRR